MHPQQGFDPSVFANPPAAFRSSPFWSLNDWLSPREIERQLALFKKGGFGGAYLHSRIGLLTPYLGDDWWKAMDAGVKACRELGIEAWFYDEDKWPSGFAGGLVPLANPAFHARQLARIDKDAPLPKDAVEVGADATYRYIEHKVPMGEAWFNGTCWVDLFNPDMVDAFIDSSYKPYAERYAADAGQTVLGIFTDEPQISPRGADFPHKGVVAWSPHLRERFRKDHGYDIAEHAASLFEKTGDFRRVRLHFYRSVGNCLEENFSKRIGGYCREHHLVWTGHYNGEGNFQSTISNVGNLMIQYRHQQRPGIDWLGLSILDGLNTAKSLSSVANQYGQERRLSEMFGCCGQNMNFEDRKWIFNWHAVLGINHACPHLSLYSMKGVRKRDYPPTISPQQPWWEHNALIEDPMARVSYAATAGTFAPEMLVLHPIESAMTEFTPGGQDRFFGPYHELLGKLMAAHRDFDLGDEQILADIGRVDGAAVIVGKMQYPLVVLPPLATIRATTVKLLAGLASNGGHVLASELPSLIDGTANTAVQAELEKAVTVVAKNALIDTLARVAPPAVTVTGPDAAQVWTQRRANGKGFTVIATNLSRKKTADIGMAIAGAGTCAVLWDTSTGKPLSLGAIDGQYPIRLAPAGTAVITDAAGITPAGVYRIAGSETTLVTLSAPFSGKRLDENAITLDFARWRKGEGAWSDPEPVIGIHERLTRERYRGPLSLAFDCAIDTVPQRIELVVEQPEMYRSILVNGRPLRFVPDRFWRDISFSRADALESVAAGANRIELTLDYVTPVPDSLDAVERYGTEMEAVYLIGDFGVTPRRSSAAPAPTTRNTIGLLPDRPVHRFSSFVVSGENRLFSGDLTPEGYPFYAGRFELTTEFDAPKPEAEAQTFIVFPEAEAQVIEATLNGRNLPPTAFSPWEIETTGALRPGKNRLRLVLTGSLRNLLGPHHHRDGELILCGPDSFTGRATWTGGGPGDDDWYEKRKTGSTKIWRDDWHCIPFGLLAAPTIVARR